MGLVEDLQDLAATWQSSGESSRLRGGAVRDAVASTLIGCSQALLNLLNDEEQ